jgi:hypothetical protein
MRRRGVASGRSETILPSARFFKARRNIMPPGLVGGCGAVKEILPDAAAEIAAVG